MEEREREGCWQVNMDVRGRGRALDGKDRDGRVTEGEKHFCCEGKVLEGNRECYRNVRGKKDFIFFGG